MGATANGATFRRCYCQDPAAGRELGADCPDIDKRRHGTWCLKIRVDTTTGRRQLKRSGFGREADASAALDTIRDLIKLAGDDERAR